MPDQDVASGPMQGFRVSDYEAAIDGKTTSFPVYKIGSGPPIIAMQELPGIGEEFIDFCRRLSKDFEIWVPHWFGPLGRTATFENSLDVICMRREFQILEANKSSKVMDWLRALCAHVADVRKVERIGVIGMCFSGNFALTLIAEEKVWAAVASQPSLPIGKRGLHMSPGEVSASINALKKKGPMHAYRFEEDWICKASRFKDIEKEFNANTGQKLVDTHQLKGKKHSVFTIHYNPDPASETAKAFVQISGYFAQQLKV